MTKKKRKPNAVFAAQNGVVASGSRRGEEAYK
jgi:hypothetical protein